MVFLRKDEQAHQDHNHNPEYNLAWGVPRVDYASKVDGHSKRYDPSNEDKDAQEIILLQLFLEGDHWLQIFRREKEENDRRKKGTDR